MDITDSVVTIQFFLELFCIICVIFVACLIIHTISEWIKTNKSGGVIFNRDIDQAITENAVEEMAVTTVRDSGGYVKNNNAFIEKRLKMFSPNFNATNFNHFATDLFARFVKTRDAEDISFISKDIDPMTLPYSIAYFEGYYLHNYIIHNNTESLKLYCTIVTEGDELTDSTKESYFLTFSRENTLIDLQSGRFLTVSCPNCGGDINMDKNLVSECPYCHNTITFAEHDWILTNVEHITPDTQICNLAMLKNNIF